jgi:short-subunit dehydrogenase
LVLGVNLWGVIHGIHFFVPRMLAQRAEGHIINTASIAGLISGPGQSVYKVSKHGIVTLSETLYHELARRDAHLKVSVLCPGLVKTNVLDSSRNRPTHLQNSPDGTESSPQKEAVRQFMQQALRNGMPPQRVADLVFEAIREERFYILPTSEWKGAIQTRMEDILQERNPTWPLAPH